jgi:hypothetical protein
LVPGEVVLPTTPGHGVSLRDNLVTDDLATSRLSDQF